jgi:hypothetical protein
MNQEAIAKDFNNSALEMADRVVEFGKTYPTVQCAEGHTEESATALMKGHAQASINDLDLTYSEWGLLQEMARQLRHMKRS